MSVMFFSAAHLLRYDDFFVIRNEISETDESYGRWVLRTLIADGSCVVPVGDGLDHRLGEAVKRMMAIDAGFSGRSFDEIMAVQRPLLEEFNQRVDKLEENTRQDPGHSIGVDVCMARSRRYVYVAGSIGLPFEPRMGLHPDPVPVPRVPFDAPAEDFGRAILDTYARVDAWCVENGVSPVTGMPRPLRQALGGGDGVVTLTPPAYGMERARGEGVLRSYKRVKDWSKTREWQAMRNPGGVLPPGEKPWDVDPRNTLCTFEWRLLPQDGASAPGTGWLAAWEGEFRPAVSHSASGAALGCFTSREEASNERRATIRYTAPLASGRLLELRLDVPLEGRRASCAAKLVAKYTRQLDTLARHTKISK